MYKVTKVISLMLVIGSLGVFLSGCDKTVQKQKKEIASLNATIESLEAEIDDLTEAVNDTTVTESKMTTSLQKVDGKIVPEFRFVEDTLVFPNKLELPGAKIDVATTKINVGSKYSFSPTDKWATRMEGSAVHVNHPTKIWGTLKALNIEDIEGLRSEDVKKDLLQQFFVGFPATNITYSKIYIDENNTGMMAYAPITVEEQNYGVIVGFNIRSPYSLSFLFTFADDGSGVQRELVNSLLKTVQYGSSQLAFE